MSGGRHIYVCPNGHVIDSPQPWDRPCPIAWCDEPLRKTTAAGAEKAVLRSMGATLADDGEGES